MKSRIQLFCTGFLQVFFVAVNTYFISELFYVGIAFVAFMISFIWSFNIKKIAFGTNIDRIVYSSGATSGSLLGTYVSQLIL